MPNGPRRKEPAPRSSSDPNTLGESKRGTQSQSTDPSGATSAAVWQFDRNAYSAIGVNGDGAAALCGAGASATAGFPFVFVCIIGAPDLLDFVAGDSCSEPRRRRTGARSRATSRV